MQTRKDDVSPIGAGGDLPAGGKSRITIRIDNEVLDGFKSRAQAAGANYQSLINDALREYLQGMDLGSMLKGAVQETLREELKRARK